ncbi:2,3-dimethylmalate dehydratase small subunit [compost metagenome]
MITPARYLNNPDPNEYSKYCMADIDSTFVSRVEKGDIIVAGQNFGCGSSREHAPLAIKTCGISCVIAGSFARIFYRNSINIGLPILESPEAVDNIKEGDAVSVNVATGEIHNLTSGQIFHSVAFPPFINNIIENGGLIGSIKAKVSSNG